MASRRTPASCAARIMRTPTSRVRTQRARPLCASLAITTGACANPHRDQFLHRAPALHRHLPPVARDTTIQAGALASPARPAQPPPAPVCPARPALPRPQSPGWRHKRRTYRSGNRGHRQGAGTRPGPAAASSSATGSGSSAEGFGSSTLASGAPAQDGTSSGAADSGSGATDSAAAGSGPAASGSAVAGAGSGAHRARVPPPGPLAGRVRPPGGAWCSSPGPSGSSPGTIRRGSTRRTGAVPGPESSARRLPRRASARWRPNPARSAQHVPCDQSTQNGRAHRASTRLTEMRLGRHGFLIPAY